MAGEVAFGQRLSCQLPRNWMSDSPVTVPDLSVRALVSASFTIIAAHRGPWAFLSWVEARRRVLSDKNVYPRFRTNSLAGNS
jgi:hypothetical protein